MVTTPKKSRSEVPHSADDPEQSERFIETAREHGTDETGKAFERLFKKAVPSKKAPNRREK